MIEAVQRIKIRDTHPSLYQTIRNVAIINVCLALNFLIFDPAFKPFNFPNYLVGLVFLAIGAGQLYYLVWKPHLKITRRLMGATVFVHLVWGVLNSQQWFNGKASLQLPIYIIGLALVVRAWHTEPAINPMTEKNGA